MKIDGKCHCGNITFVAEIDPDKVIICHCTDCQTLTGTAFRVVVRAPKDKFELRGGKPKTYTKTAESGAKRVQAFCPECGTPEAYRRALAAGVEDATVVTTAYTGRAARVIRTAFIEALERAGRQPREQPPEHRRQHLVGTGRGERALAGAREGRALGRYDPGGIHWYTSVALD